MRSVSHPTEAAIDDNIDEDGGGGGSKEEPLASKNEEDKLVSIAVLTQTTPTLTPTRIQNIEEDFFHALQVKPPETHVNQAGFIPPLVRVISRDHSGPSIPLALPELVPLPVTMPAQSAKTSPSKRRSSRQNVDPDEDVRRKMRRERNKQAAARCRKRRLDQTLTLQKEVDQLEDKRQSLQNEIMALQSQKNELERILLDHPCKMDFKPKTKPIRPNSLALPLALTSAASSASLSEPMDLVTPSKGLNLFESENWPVLTPTALSLLDTPGTGGNNVDGFPT